MDRAAAHHRPLSSSSTTTAVLLLFAGTYLLLLQFQHPRNSIPSLSAATDPCESRYIYVHRLPSRFNDDLLRHCRELNPWTDMCPLLSNSGLGPALHDRSFFLPADCWYGTHQFSLDVVFHQRLKSYECLTGDPSKASAVFVPFYAGLEAGRYLWGPYNASLRDGYAVDLAEWLTARPEWSAMWGGDHFMVAGRITWDFRRPEAADGWGNRLLLLSAVRNMTTFVLETTPRREPHDGCRDADVAIPYPTYFHPRSRRDVVTWQRRVRRMRRTWLFAFVGAPRADGGLRSTAMEQCRTSRRCRLLDCRGEAARRCYSAAHVMSVFGESRFCLQPPGDSLTRRSAFDSMVLGCIPVFFGNGSAAEQYKWHLDTGGRAYSVVIGEEEMSGGKVGIEKLLMGIGEEEERRMREEVIEMMPRLVYRHPEWTGESVRDAFDVAVDGVLRTVERKRKGC